MTRGTRNRRLAAGLIGLAAGAAYWFVLKPRLARWGATDDEAHAILPGDDLVPYPKMNSTRAVTIYAPAGEVWPWLAQMGQDKGGFYSYDWLENLMGLDIHNASRVVRDYQQVQVGDKMKIGPDRSFTVAQVEANRSLVFQQQLNLRTGRALQPYDPIPNRYLLVTWAFALREVNRRSIRLVVRFRLDYNASLLNFLLWRFFIEPAHFVMERKMLLGIKQRAESTLT